MENEQDFRFRATMVEVAQVDPEMCANISQQDLRNGLFALRTSAALVEKYLDIRNEQGRGGLSSQS